MSKRNRGNRPQAQLNKAMPAIAPAPVADSAVLKQMAEQYNLVAYSPNVPILPYPGMQPQYGPRQWQYPIATNLDLVTRENLTPFEILRRFAQMYDAIALCKQAWFDCAANLEPSIEPAPGLLADGEDASKYEAEMATYQEFFESPDKQIDIHEWINAALNDLADIDAVAIYPRLTMAGELYSLDLIDGATVKPLLDERGRTPEPPDYAYEQIVYGAPSGLYTNEQLLYLKEHTRTNSAFGFSRVESVLVRINQALRKQNFDLAKFTDGTVPPGFLSPSADVGWTPDQMIAYQQMFDAALAGNDALRARLRWVPPGTVYTPTSPGGSTTDAMILDLDKFILTMTGASFGVMLPELGFTETVNKSSGETQEDVTFRRTLRPIAKRFARLFNFILKHFFNERRFIFAWKGYEASEDFNALSAAHVSLVGAGIETIGDANRALKQPYDGPDIPRFIMTATGPFVVDDLANAQLRKAQVDSQMAGLKMAANPQPAQPQQDGNEAAPAPSLPPKDEQKQQIKRAAGDEEQTGMMVAFMIDVPTAMALALPDGEPIDDLHVTLAYLGETSDTRFDPAITPTLLKTAVANFAMHMTPLQGNIGGILRFTSVPEGEPTPVCAAVDVPGLSELRNALITRLDAVGYAADATHGYTPHITLAYIDAGDPTPIHSIAAIPLTFISICLAIGNERYEFPLGPHDDASPEVMRAARVELRKWRDLAFSRMKSGKAQRAFVSEILPESLTESFARTLAVCQTPEELRMVFDSVQDQHIFARLDTQGVDPNEVMNTQIWQEADPDIQKRLAQYRAQGVRLKRWNAGPGACDNCLANDGQVVPLDGTFASGAYLEPGHNHCGCKVEMLGAPIAQGAAA